jgi:hypothetical protein
MLLPRIMGTEAVSAVGKRQLDLFFHATINFAHPLDIV